MSTSKDPVLGGPAEQEPLGELFGAVFELAGQAASRLSPDEVDARLHRIVRKASRPVGASSSSGPCTAADPRSVTLDGHHPDRQDTVQAGSVLAFPRKSTRDSPAGPELRPASAPPTSSPDVFVAGPGSDLSGENVIFRRRDDGRVISVLLVHGTYLRLDPYPTQVTHLRQAATPGPARAPRA